MCKKNLSYNVFFEPDFYSQALSGGSGFVQRNNNKFENSKFFISFVSNKHYIYP
jgi:hypothetical protein